MKRTVTAVAFDLDGTLVDTMAVVPGVYVDTIRSLGGPDLDPGQVTAIWHIGPTATVLGHFLGRRVTAADLDHFYATFRVAAAPIRPFDGIAAMLDALREDGYRVGVYTAATGRAAELMLTTAGLIDRFRAVVGGDQARRPKPAPDGLLQLVGLLGTTPGQTVYVGDSDVDLRCAEAASCRPILAGWGGSRTGSSPRPGPQPGPGTAIARTPQDVVAIVRDRGR